MSRRSILTIGPAPSRPIRWDALPKPDGGVRRLVVLEQADELGFARSVAGAAPAIRLAMRSESHANRVVDWDRRGPILEPWGRARLRWLREVRRLASDARFVAVTDARACYASIAPTVTTERLRVLGTGEACAHEVGSWLRAFGDVGVDGLPVGPATSALLADVVLSAGDDAIHGTGAEHVRWVDDVAIFAPDRRTRAAALEALSRVWASLGVQLHDGKTVLLEAPVAEVHLGAVSSSTACCSTLR